MTISAIAEGLCGNAEDLTLQRVGMERIHAEARQAVENDADNPAANAALILSGICLGIDHGAGRAQVLAALSDYIGMGAIDLDNDAAIHGALTMLNYQCCDNHNSDFYLVKIILSSLAGQPVPVEESWEIIALALRKLPV